MKRSSKASQKKLLAKVKKRALTLKAERDKKSVKKTGDESINISVNKSQARLKKVKDSEGDDVGDANFFLEIDVTALKDAVYIPLSIASSQKPTGFIYHIEGTDRARILETDITCRGTGVTQVTLGTLLYTKIPAKKTGRFRILIKLRGKPSKEYKIVIHRLNYKFAPQDTRYQRFDTKISTRTAKLS